MTAASLNSLALWIEAHPYLALLVLIWTFAWKGFGLWRSAELRHQGWFVAILLINTLGILEIIYLFFVAKDYKVEVVEN